MNASTREVWFASLIGRTVNRLTALREHDERADNGRRLLLCVCECGTETPVRPHLFESGKVVSCGCYASERIARRNYRHGGRGLPEYGVWTAMIGRCHNSKNKAYKSYGARGITVCPRWRESFATFLEDMGARPSDMLSIDREDNDKGYEPGNCRWATDREQNNNRRVTVRVTIDGVTRPLSEWCEVRGLNYQTVWARIYKQGWSAEKALATPRTEQTCLVEHRGESLPLHVWAKRLGVPYKRLHDRLFKLGWSVEEALAT